MLVESALVMICLIGTVLSILDVGQYLFLEQTFRDRARFAARYAVVHNYDVEQVKNVVLYNTPTAPGGGRSGLFGLTADNVTVTRYEENTPRDRIEVKISNFPIRFYTLFLSRTATRPVFRSVMAVESLGATD